MGKNKLDLNLKKHFFLFLFLFKSFPDSKLEITQRDIVKMIIMHVTPDFKMSCSRPIQI